VPLFASLSLIKPEDLKMAENGLSAVLVPIFPGPCNKSPFSALKKKRT
jgi:hypothetical protein